MHGSVSVTAKVHDGRVAEVVYATTESTREAELLERADRKPNRAKT